MNLEKLVFESTAAETATMIATAESQYAFFRRSSVCSQIEDSFKGGTTSIEDLREVFATIFGTFERGKRFHGEVYLALLAVALERVPGREAETFITELADLRIQEVRFAHKVAGIALTGREKRITPSTSRTVTLSDSIVTYVRSDFKFRSNCVETTTSLDVRTRNWSNNVAA